MKLGRRGDKPILGTWKFNSICYGIMHKLIENDFSNRGICIECLSIHMLYINFSWLFGLFVIYTDFNIPLLYGNDRLDAFFTFFFGVLHVSRLSIQYEYYIWKYLRHVRNWWRFDGFLYLMINEIRAPLPLLYFPPPSLYRDASVQIQILQMLSNHF